MMALLYFIIIVIISIFFFIGSLPRKEADIFEVNDIIQPSDVESWEENISYKVLAVGKRNYLIHFLSNNGRISKYVEPRTINKENAHFLYEKVEKNVTT